MEGRSPEFSPEIPKETPSKSRLDREKPEETDAGFSETKSAKVIEGKGMDTKQVLPAGRQVKKRKPIISATTRVLHPLRIPRPIRQRVVPSTAPITELSRKEKIVLAYKANADALLGLVDLLYTIDGSNFRQEEQALDEIKEKRHLQDELLHALVLEQRHQLTEEAISKEAWNLIK